MIVEEGDLLDLDLVVVVDLVDELDFVGLAVCLTSKLTLAR